MSQSNKIIRYLLRLITPDEISELTKIAGSKPKVSLTEILENEISKDHNKNEKNFSSDGDGVSDEEKVDDSKEGRKDEFSEKELSLGAKKEDVLRGSLFILSQKEKLKSSVSRIKGKEVLELYKKNSSVDINQEKESRKRADRTLTSHTGVLVNKRQF
jgi:hypothetical protein